MQKIMENLSIILAQSHRLVFQSIHFSVVRHDSFQIYVIFLMGLKNLFHIGCFGLFCFFQSTRIYWEKAVAPHSNTLAWKIPWTEEPGGLQSLGVAKSRTPLSDFTFTFHFHALEKEMATYSSVLAWRIPGTGKPGGLPSMGSHRVGHD